MIRSISLVGMPGGGKTTVGRQLAKRLGERFVDTDIVIESRIGRSIREFFNSEGEAAFRAIEAEVLAELVAGPPSVIATGGGIVLARANREALGRATTCVYLRSSPEELHRRLRHDLKRPLLQVADPLARLRELHQARDPLYREAARFIVDTGRPTVAALVRTILMQLELGGTDANDPPSPPQPR